MTGAPNDPNARERKMKIVIKDSGEKKDLKLIQPFSGMDWLEDVLRFRTAMGSSHSPSFVNGVCMMSQEDFEWWKDYTARYQRADFRFYGLFVSGANYQRLEAATKILDSSADDYPERLSAICERFERDYKLNKAPANGQRPGQQKPNISDERRAP